VPADAIVYAIGDVHGRADLLAKILAAIHDDVAACSARRRVLVFLGDYLNRGPESRAVVELAIDPGLPGFEVVRLKGNNEDLLVRFLEGDLAAGAHWLDYGGLDTLASYGIPLSRFRSRDPSVLEALRQRSDSLPDYGVAVASEHAPAPSVLEKLRFDLADRLPARHLSFFRSLQVAHREDGYYFVHAGILPGVPMDEQTDRDRMWIRDRFLESTLDHGVVVVHGHTVTPEPVIRANRIGIDTGAWRTGVLTCLVLEGDQRAFLST
jgi:serine/threonine protein phosphatase 1